MFDFGHNRFLCDRRLQHGAAGTAMSGWSSWAQRRDGHRVRRHAAGCGSDRAGGQWCHFTRSLDPQRVAVAVGEGQFGPFQEHHQLDHAEDAETLLKGNIEIMVRKRNDELFDSENGLNHQLYRNKVHGTWLRAEVEESQVLVVLVLRYCLIGMCLKFMSFL